MTEPVRTLYEYACKTRVPALLSGKDYEELRKIVERQEDRLAALLPPRWHTNLGRLLRRFLPDAVHGARGRLPGRAVPGAGIGSGVDNRVLTFSGLPCDESPRHALRRGPPPFYKGGETGLAENRSDLHKLGRFAPLPPL